MPTESVLYTGTLTIGPPTFTRGDWLELSNALTGTDGTLSPLRFIFLPLDFILLPLLLLVFPLRLCLQPMNFLFAPIDSIAFLWRMLPPLLSFVAAPARWVGLGVFTWRLVDRLFRSYRQRDGRRWERH